MNKKGQGNLSPGLITGLVFGVASLVIGVIIAFVIITTLTGANLLPQTSDTITVTNETGAWVNRTTYTLDGFNSTWSSISATFVYNQTSGAALPAANFSLGASTGVLTNATNAEYGNATISYTYTFTRDSVEKDSVDALSANFTAGVNEVSKKIPTVLLIAAIVLILGVLAILVMVWQRMRMGNSSGL